MFILSFICVSINYVTTKKISSKPARVTLAGTRHLLAVAEVSDSVTALPPNLIVYSVGQGVSKVSTISGPCYSLGRAIAPFQQGFYATAPASAYRWGEPGPLLYKVFPPAHEMIRFSDKRVPYGETIGASYKGKTMVLCSPYSNGGCILSKTFTNTTTDLEKPSGVSLFGLGVAVSPNGTVVAALSRGTGNMLNLHFITNEVMSASFSIPMDGKVTLRRKTPFLHFSDERHLYMGLPEISKIFVYKNTVNGWIMMKVYDMPMSAMASMGADFVVVTEDGRVQIVDKNFVQKGDEIVPRSIVNGKFTEVAAGANWFAVMEESADRRRLHVYTTKGSRFMRGLLFLVLSFAFMIIILYVRVNSDMGQILGRLKKKSGREAKSV